MSAHVSYELQTFLNGAWKIDSVYDDRQIAVYEAQRLHGSGRYSAIRVVEERYDDVSGIVAAKTIFRAAKADSANAESLERQKSARREVAAARRAAPKGELRAAGPAPRGKSGLGAVGLTLLLGGIVLAGIAVIIGIRYLFGAV